MSFESPWTEDGTIIFLNHNNWCTTLCYNIAILLFIYVSFLSRVISHGLLKKMLYILYILITFIFKAVT